MTDQFPSLPCGLFSFDDEGRILAVNDTLCAWLQRSPEALEGQKVNVLLTLPSLIFYQTHFFPLLKMQQAAEEIFLTLKAADGTGIPVLVSARRTEAELRTANVCCCLALWNRVNYEEELIAARNKAEKALQENTALLEVQARLQQQIALLDEKMFQLEQRNEELQERNTVVAHDLQEPLRKISLYADLLLSPQPPKPPEEMVQKILQMTRSIRERLLGIQRYSLLDTEPLKLTEVPLNEVVHIAKQKVVTDFAGVEVHLYADDLPPVTGDHQQLVVLFYELIANSVQFRSPLRPLEIRLESTLLNRNLFRVLEDQYRFGDHYKITFSDNGIGFPSGFEKKVFQLFRKIHTSSKGLGIGLTVCKKIVANHRGTLSVKSIEGKGTTFTIYLPVLPPE
ncbi:ATP-binding protein [Paraflavisolibacter sp. H34]|uniref:ATP-binding protein n=1 Tax=Huijunlia imazamoxiresistens TaxID=3127457 RepID=UPI0030186B90